MRMHTFVAAAIVFGGISHPPLAVAQQSTEAATSIVGPRWKGVWSSNTSVATGDLLVQVTEIEGDRVRGKLQMTRPSNAQWQCKDTLEDVAGEKSGDEITLSIDFGGRCNLNTFTFTVKDGKLRGLYKTQSGSSGTYTLDRQ